MIRHQQIDEGHVFVEPRSRDTARGLLDAAKAVGLDSSTVRTQQGGYLVPEEVAAEWQKTAKPDDVEVTEGESSGDEGAPSKSADKQKWFDYAVSQGFDGDYDDVTKGDLIERYGATE